MLERKLQALRTQINERKLVIVVTDVEGKIVAEPIVAPGRLGQSLDETDPDFVRLRTEFYNRKVRRLRLYSVPAVRSKVEAISAMNDLLEEVT